MADITCSDCQWYKERRCYNKPPVQLIESEDWDEWIRPATEPDDKTCFEFRFKDGE